MNTRQRLDFHRVDWNVAPADFLARNFGCNQHTTVMKPTKKKENKSCNKCETFVLVSFSRIQMTSNSSCSPSRRGNLHDDIYHKILVRDR
jgi:hypothetical protein